MLPDDNDKVKNPPEGFLEFVREQADFHDHRVKTATERLKKSENGSQSAARQERIRNTSARLRAKFSELASWLEDIPARTQRSGSSPNSFRSTRQLHPDDLEGLPQELLAQLSLSEADQEEMKIVNLVDDAGGELSLDHLIIAIYRETKEVKDRKTLLARIHRMIRKELIYSVPGTKGVYTTNNPDEVVGDGFQFSEKSPGPDD